jgi:hypothetical protein
MIRFLSHAHFDWETANLSPVRRFFTPAGGQRLSWLGPNHAKHSVFQNGLHAGERLSALALECLHGR